MRRYVGEGGKGGRYTGHREAGMTKRMGKTTMMSSSVMTSSSASSRLAMKMLKGQHGSLVSSPVMR